MLKLLVIALALLIVAPEATNAQRARHKRKPTHVAGGVENGWPPGKDSLLYKYTRQLPTVDTVEVNEVRLGPTEGQGYETKTLKTVTLHGVDAERFAKVWRVLNNGEGAGCFSPAYMVKFFADQKLLLGSTICFHCRNLTLPTGNSSEIYSFDAVGPTGKNLLAAIQAALANTQ
jgi:hypothetical protein